MSNKKIIKSMGNGIAFSIGLLIDFIGINIILVAIGVMPKHQALAVVGVIFGSALITSILGLTAYHMGGSK